MSIRALLNYFKEQIFSESLFSYTGVLPVVSVKASQKKCR